ncbi:type II toxin-antitoxin system RelE/ParE family toxin [Mucilaginibacter sp. X4EP1]|uniref:type II toxin-antitoxin system RelE/ParE family toxin n=1 Tax=Mucilaginibacter sp. X4EP1 TaxID=2723092 RepID=UPI00216819E8|nr:type II toxin-antitoxin system RelE/ParE family toxin [Mucilaginibacter sp. X4EP1]MCS3814332.1 plasmid stabilization system protein ParE [Mucilaginibacter sp. X4EP1]
MIFELKFTPEAEETYDSLTSQLQERWGDQFAIKFETKVLKALEAISVSPYLYPIIEESTEVRRCVLHKNCSMLYKVFDDVVLIVCFWDNRQDPLFSH